MAEVKGRRIRNVHSLTSATPINLESRFIFVSSHVGIVIRNWLSAKPKGMSSGNHGCFVTSKPRGSWHSYSGSPLLIEPGKNCVALKGVPGLLLAVGLARRPDLDRSPGQLR